MVAVQSLILTDGWDFTHVRDHHTARTTDETWLPRFALEGGKAIVSADRKMLARPHQLGAIVASDLICVFLSQQWAQCRRHEQAAQILHWWPRIEKTIIASKPRDCWRVPHGYSTTAPLEKINVNFAKAAAASNKKGGGG